MYYVLCIQWDRLLCVGFWERFSCAAVVHSCFATTCRYSGERVRLDDGVQERKMIVICVAEVQSVVFVRYGYKCKVTG